MTDTTEGIVHIASLELTDTTPFAIFTPEVSMMVLTWITFFILLAILHKFAWKPILTALDQREEMIRRCVEDAKKTKEELAKISDTRERIVKESEAKAKEIIEQSRKAAREAAKVIEEKTKQEVQILLENANREILSAQEKAIFWLKEKSADMAVILASKVLQENLDNEKNRSLVDKLVKEIT